MHNKKKKKNEGHIQSFAFCAYYDLLLEPGDGGLSKFSLLSGRGSVILWQKEIAQKPKI